MMQPDGIERLFALARTKSDLHRAIDALPEGATMIVVANACCCGDAEHASSAGSAVFHLACGSPSLAEAVGLLRLAEHAIVSDHTT